MSKSIFLTQASGLTIAALAAGFLAGCQQNSGASNVAAAAPPAATIPLADTPPSGPIATAPPAQALPAYTIRHVAPARASDAYAFAERARYASYGYGDAPPDYGFDYGGVSPWAWQGDNGYTTVVEPVADGDRYYYYAPGEDTPYYVRDPDYGYGYQGGVLVVVYDRHGRPLPDTDASGRWDEGGRYFRRGQDLWRASRGQRHAVERAHWQQRRDNLDRDQAWWGQAQSQNPDWQAYDTQNGPQYQNTWRQERYRREAEAYRVDQASNDGARAQREHDQALVAVGVAGAAGGLLAGGLFGQHAKPPPAPSVATAPPPLAPSGGKPMFGAPGATPPSLAAGAKPPFGGPGATSPPAGASPSVQAEREAMARQQEALKNQQGAAAQQAAALRAQQQAAAQHGAFARQEAAAQARSAGRAAAQQPAADQQAAALRAQQQAAAQHEAVAHQEAAAQARSAAAAQAAAQQAAAQSAAAARQQAAAQAQFRAEEARVAHLQAQQAQSAQTRQEQAAAQQRAESARVTQAEAQQKAEAARLTLVQSQQHAEAARQAQAQAQQRAVAARQAQVGVQAQERQKAEAAAKAKAQSGTAGETKAGRPNPTP